MGILGLQDNWWYLLVLVCPFRATSRAVHMHMPNPSAPIEVYQLPVDRLRPVLKSAGTSVLKQAREHLQQAFDTLLASDDRLNSWMLRMQELEMQAVVFGGWARDRLVETIHGRVCHSRDIDFVAEGKVSVAKILPEDAVLNPFGGFGAQATSIHVDAWDLKNTFLIRLHR
jgi:hypothetical protein